MHSIFIQLWKKLYAQLELLIKHTVQKEGRTEMISVIAKDGIFLFFPSCFIYDRTNGVKWYTILINSILNQASVWIKMIENLRV